MKNTYKYIFIIMAVSAVLGCSRTQPAGSSSSGTETAIEPVIITSDAYDSGEEVKVKFVITGPQALGNIRAQAGINIVDSGPRRIRIPWDQELTTTSTQVIQLTTNIENPQKAAYTAQIFVNGVEVISETISDNPVNFDLKYN